MLEADIDLGLESGAAAFDPPSLLFSANAPSPIHHQNRLTLHHQRAFTAHRHQEAWLLLLLMHRLKVHVRFVCLTSRLFADFLPLCPPYGHPLLPPLSLPTRRFACSSLLQTPGPTCLAHPCFSPLSRLARRSPGVPGLRFISLLLVKTKFRLLPFLRIHAAVDSTLLRSLRGLELKSVRRAAATTDLECTVELIPEDGILGRGGAAGCRPWPRRKLISSFRCLLPGRGWAKPRRTVFVDNASRDENSKIKRKQRQPGKIFSTLSL